MEIKIVGAFQVMPAKLATTLSHPQTMLNFEQKCVEMSPFLGTTSLGGVERMDGCTQSQSNICHLRRRVLCNSDLEAGFSQCLKFFLLPLKL